MTSDAAAAESALAAQAGEVERLKDVLHRDRSGLAAALASIGKEVQSREWLLTSRGPYEWDDDHYKDEAGHAMRAVAKIASDALAASGNLAHAECCAPSAAGPRSGLRGGEGHSA